MKSIDPHRVRKRRDDLGISQQQLAARISEGGFGPLSYQSIQQLEDGSIKKPRYAMYLAAALETSWEYLIGQTNNPGISEFNDSVTNSSSNGTASLPKGGGQEGTQVLIEISRMLGSVEGSLKTTFNTRFDVIDRKLDEHERRLESLEGRLTDPQKGRRR